MHFIRSLGSVYTVITSTMSTLTVTGMGSDVNRPLMQQNATYSERDRDDQHGRRDDHNSFQSDDSARYGHIRILHYDHKW